MIIQPHHSCTITIYPAKCVYHFCRGLLCLVYIFCRRKIYQYNEWDHYEIFDMNKSKMHQRSTHFITQFHYDNDCQQVRVLVVYLIYLSTDIIINASHTQQIINAIYLHYRENPFHVWDNKVDRLYVPCATHTAPAGSFVTGAFLVLSI